VIRLLLIAAAVLAAALMAAHSNADASGCRQPAVTEIPTPPLGPRAPGPLTIASLNMAEETDYRRALQEFQESETLSAAAVVLLQEVVYSDSLDGLLQGLARELGVQAVFSSATQPRADGRVDGIALLSRLPIQSAEAFALTAFNLNVRSRCRHALSVTLATPDGQSMQAFNVHLDTRINAQNRVRQLQSVVEAAKRFAGPVVIGGDMNTNPNFWIQHLIPIPWAHDQHGPLDQLFSSHGFATPMDGSEATHDLLGLRLDWIYLRGVAGSAWGVEAVDFSDHRAVWLRFDDGML
jgi:endonuclease/exonuclease/phosphatase family metal-dependent hydrolase